MRVREVEDNSFDGEVFRLSSTSPDDRRFLTRLAEFKGQLQVFSIRRKGKLVHSLRLTHTTHKSR